MSVRITIDGKSYDVPEGSRLIDACMDVGIDIPHFCYHPGLGPDGNCRMCQVEIVTERGPMLAISCNTIVRDGMEVITNSERVREIRAAVEEFLLLDHPLDCPICDKAGECTLQNYYWEHDLRDSRMEFPREKKGKAIVLGKTLILDQERCVLCSRCVRFLRDIAHDEELFIAGRGHRSYITTFPGREVTSPYSLNTVDLCPVGALTSRDFRFAVPTWFLTRSPSVCMTCERGCSIEIDHRAGKVYRLRPRHNPEVNDYWMCDEGRLNYAFINENRITAFRIKKNGAKIEVSREIALRDVLSAVDRSKTAPSEVGERGGGKILILASLTCTLEELFLLKMLEASGEGVSLFAVRHMPDGPEDDLLRKRNRHPNARAAEMLGLRTIDSRDGGTGLDAIAPAISGGSVLIGVGFNYGVPQGLLDLFSRPTEKIFIAACRTPISEQAEILLPGLTFAEKDGLVVNFEGQIQRLVPALEAEGDGTSDWKLINEMLSSLAAGSGFETLEEVRAAISREEAAFADVNLNAVGPTGIRLSNLPVA